VIERFRIPSEIVRVIPGGIDTKKADPGISRSEARQRLGLPSDRPIIICIRRLVRRVGVDVLVDAVRLLRPKHPDLLVLIGGTGPLAGELNAKIDAFGLHDHVRLLGYVADSDLPIAYAAADFSIVPTQSLEGFGLVTIESMAAGTPAIVTPVGSLPEIANRLSTNLILGGTDAEAIAGGLDSILKVGSTLPSSDQCRAFVLARFDWQIIAPQVLSVYRDANK
jgi:glycosyltransferase involved in cell wall biosynthesis